MFMGKTTDLGRTTIILYMLNAAHRNQTLVSAGRDRHIPFCILAIVCILAIIVSLWAQM